MPYCLLRRVVIQVNFLFPYCITLVYGSECCPMCSFLVCVGLAFFGLLQLTFFWVDGRGLALGGMFCGWSMRFMPRQEIVFFVWAGVFVGRRPLPSQLQGFLVCLKNWVRSKNIKMCTSAPITLDWVGGSCL